MPAYTAQRLQQYTLSLSLFLSISHTLTQITDQKAEKKKNLNFCDTRSKAENGVYENVQRRIQPEKPSKEKCRMTRKNAETNKSEKDRLDEKKYKLKVPILEISIDRK